jgi:hypothetical protein
LCYYDIEIINIATRIKDERPDARVGEKDAQGGQGMPRDWQELTHMTGAAEFVVERVRIVQKNITIEGEFDLPPLARLSAEDQVFIMAFVRCDGSIKDMEKTFGISYPTVKSRLTRIAQQFQFEETPVASPKEEILKQLETGAITAAEAIERLSR